MTRRSRIGRRTQSFPRARARPPRANPDTTTTVKRRPPAVGRALAVAHDMSWEDIVSEAIRKRAERGGFDNRILLEYVDQAR